MKSILGHLAFILVVFQTNAQGIKSVQKASDKAYKIMNPKNGNMVQSPVSLVNPFVGTGGHGHTFPGATAPSEGYI